MTESPKEPRKSTRDRIAEAVIRIVSRSGTAGASVRRITRAAGCNESVLYDHFKNKAAMQRIVFDELIDRRNTMYCSSSKSRLMRTCSDRSLCDKAIHRESETR